MNYAIIVGGGKGKRMNSKVNKILLSLNEKPLLYYTIKKFEDCKEIDEIILVINEDDEEMIFSIVEKYGFNKIKNIVNGGVKRQDSVYNGLMMVKEGKDDDIILIHNAANPFVSVDTISNVIEGTKEFGAAVAAMLSIDTLREVDDDLLSVMPLDRSRIWRMQTPQGIKFSLTKRAFEKAYEDNFYSTDDVGLVERLGVKVKIVESNKENIKITTPEDFITAEKFVGNRVGLGQDSHKFDTEDKDLVLGGVVIPDHNGLKANSDGDVVLHALFNALSQAIGMKSIGEYADKMCLEDGITDSKEYVKFILDKVKTEGFSINNIGVMIEAKEPHLGGYHDKMKKSLSELLNIDEKKVGLTFTSGEELTSFGKGLGIQCFVICLLKKR